MLYRYYECLAQFICFFAMYWVIHFIVYKFAPTPVEFALKKSGTAENMDRQQYWFWYIEYSSWTHGWLSIIWGAYSIYTSGTRANDITTQLEFLIMMNSMGYFMYDTVLEVYLGIMDFNNLIHHLCAVCPMLAAVYLDYGGSSIVALCFWAELSNPCYLRRNYYKRIGLEETVKCNICLWGYAAVFGYCRTVIFYDIMVQAVLTPKTHIFLKFWCCLFCYISHGWIIYLIGMLWKSLPTWFPDKEKAKNYDWWITGRNLYKKVVKTEPSHTVIVLCVLVFSFIIPFYRGCMMTYNHYIETSASELMQ